MLSLLVVLFFTASSLKKGKTPAWQLPSVDTILDLSLMPIGRVVNQYEMVDLPPDSCATLLPAAISHLV